MVLDTLRQRVALGLRGQLDPRDQQGRLGLRDRLGLLVVEALR